MAIMKVETEIIVCIAASPI